MKPRVLTILAIWIAGNSCYSFSQRELQVSESNQSYLGVQTRDITASEVDNLKLPQEAGVYVVRFEEDSPAAKADLREGNVMIQFGTLSFFSVRQFQQLVSETPVGRQLELVIIREGQRTSKTVTLDEGGFSKRYRFLGSRGIEVPRERLYLKHANPLLRDIATLMLDTGKRPKEVYTINGKNVNLKDRFMFIPKGKTSFSIRTIPLTPVPMRSSKGAIDVGTCLFPA